VVHQFITKLQLSSCSLPSAATKARAKEAGVRSDKHFPGYNITSTNRFHTDRRRVQIGAPQHAQPPGGGDEHPGPTQRTNQEKLGRSVNRAGARVGDCKGRRAEK